MGSDKEKMTRHSARIRWSVAVAIIGCGLATRIGRAEEKATLKAVKQIPADARGEHAMGNRQPLQPSPLIKLPIGSITPKGWLRYQLESEAKGMIGRLAEISPWC